MDNLVISDTSCLIAFERIERLDILQKTFSLIYITQQIADEFEKPLPDWIIVRGYSDNDRYNELRNLLDKGEASAITLALEIYATLIIDERKGRQIAKSLHIEIIGTLKVLLLAKQKGVIKSVKEIIDSLQSNSFRFNHQIRDEVLRIAKEL